MALPNLTGPQRRDFTLSKSAIDPEARTVELSFSSTKPVARFYGNETLSHEPGAVDLTRFNTGAPLLVNHNPEDQIGKVETAGIRDGKGRATVRFSKSARAQEIFQDVQDGIRELVSVGYNVKDVKETSRGEFFVTKWEPLEISIVAIPADSSVGVGRSHKGTMSAAQTEDAPEMIREVENKDHAEILALGRHTGTMDAAKRAILAGESVEQFRKRALASMGAARPIGEAERHPETETRTVAGGLWTRENCIGMSDEERGEYSFARAIASVANGGRLDGLEGEASRAAEKLYGRGSAGLGFTVPLDVLIHKRTMVAGNNPAGGFLVASELHSEAFVDRLRNRAVISSLGTRLLTGLRGDVVIPKLNGDVTASWLTETGQVTQTDLTLGQVVMTPKRVAASNVYSKQLVIQSSLDIETMIRDNMAKQIALAWDLKAIAGTGASGEPLGILNTTGLSTSVTFGAAATWANIVLFETNLAASNADTGSIGWIVSPATRGKWKSAVKVTNQAVFLWEAGDLVNSYKAYATNQIPSGDKVIFGNFSDLMIGMWGGLDVVIDPYSAARNNQVYVTTNMWCDVALARPTSFVISTDSGAQ
jgi:HK97 family phage major capsid protein/HK97 family phage prohead protease